MSNQPNFFTQNILKKIYIYCILLICSAMFLVKGHSFITTITNYYTSDTNVDFQEHLERAKHSCHNENKCLRSVLCEKMDNQQLEAEKKKFIAKNSFWRRRNISTEGYPILFILIFASIHLLILRKDKENGPS